MKIVYGGSWWDLAGQMTMFQSCYLVAMGYTTSANVAGLGKQSWKLEEPKSCDNESRVALPLSSGHLLCAGHLVLV